MSKSNIFKGHQTKKQINAPKNLDDYSFDDYAGSYIPENVDRINRRKSAEARRRLEDYQENLKLQELIDGDRWF